MKKVIFAILISSFMALPALAVVTPGHIPTASDLNVQESPVTSTQGLLNVIAGIVTWVYTIFFILAVVFILFAAFTYLTASGDPSKISTAHKQLIYAAVAIAVALLAVGFEKIIELFLKNPSSTTY